MLDIFIVSVVLLNNFKNVFKLSEFNVIEDNTLNDIFEYKTQKSEDFWNNKLSLGHKEINQKINKELINS